MFKKIFIVLLIFIFTLLSFRPFFVFTQDNGGNKEEIDELNKKIAEKKEKIKQMEKTIDDYKKKIDQKKLETISLTNQLSILENRITRVGLDIETTNEKLQTISLEIESLKLIIEDKEETITKQKIIIAGLIRKMNQENDKNFLEIVTAYDNFSSFFNNLHDMEVLQRDVGKNAKSLRISKEELEIKKQSMEERKKVYETLNEELTNKKKDLDEEIGVKDYLLTQTHASELQYKSLLNSLKSQYQAIEGEISGIEKEVRKKLEENQSKSNVLESDSGTSLSWPSQSRYITAYFYDPDYPYRNIFEHNAVDMRVSQGTPLKASASGYVARAKTCAVASCYSYVMLLHSGGIATVYGHLSGIVVKEDQFVTRGDLIGYSGGRPGTVGAGPFTTGAHLHFEVRKNGIPVNPLNYLVKDY